MKYRTFLLAGAALQAGVAQAMGLGAVDVQSYLGYPLKAQIKLLSSEELSTSEIRVKVADIALYDRMNARFEASHNDMRFDIVTTASGDRVVQIRTGKRIVEPYLDLVVELSWPTGTTYRRLNLLLDPPDYAQRWRQPETSVATTSSVASTPVATPEPVLQTRTATVPQAQYNVDMEHHYVVRSGDSLWTVAKQFRSGTGLSIQQTMDLLYQNNPKAFIGGDINRLMLGATLLVPSYPEPRTTVVTNTPTVPEQAKPADVVTAAITPVPLTDAAAIRAQLAALRSEREQLLQLQQSIRDEMSRLQQQSETVQENLEATVADLRADLVPVSEIVYAAPAPAPKLESTILPEPSRLPPPSLVQAQAPLNEPASVPVAKQEAVVDVHSASARDLLLTEGSTSYWWLLGLLPLGAAVAWLSARQRKRTEQSTAEEDIDDLYEVVFGQSRNRDRQESPEKLQKAMHQIRAKAQLHELAPEQDEQDEAEASQDDVTQMIELYMMYHQYQRALGVIQTEIAKRPTRKDLRLYLMEIFARTGDHEAFDEQMAVLRRIGDGDMLNQAEQLRRHLMSEELQRDVG